MITISHEIDGKKYELVPEICFCAGCDLKNICQERYPEIVGFNGCSICAQLRGIWKEVQK